MKRITLTITVLGIFSVLATAALAGGGMSTHMTATYINTGYNHEISDNIVQVNQGCYGGHQGGGYYGGYHGGGYGYRAYYPPVWGYGPAVTRFPAHPPMFYPPVYRQYYYPRNSFYYATPGFSVGVGF